MRSASGANQIHCVSFIQHQNAFEKSNSAGKKACVCGLGLVRWSARPAILMLCAVGAFNARGQKKLLAVHFIINRRSRLCALRPGCGQA
jgi:hypothetical protein